MNSDLFYTFPFHFCLWGCCQNCWLHKSHILLLLSGPSVQITRNTLYRNSVVQTPFSTSLYSLWAQETVIAESVLYWFVLPYAIIGQGFLGSDCRMGTFPKNTQSHTCGSNRSLAGDSFHLLQLYQEYVETPSSLIDSCIYRFSEISTNFSESWYTQRKVPRSHWLYIEDDCQALLHMLHISPWA